MNAPKMYKKIRSFTWTDEVITPESSELLVETPLEITINRDRQVLIMFTPGMTRELVFGFLFTEGLIKEVSDVRHCDVTYRGGGEEDQVVEVDVGIREVEALSAGAGSRRISYSSCGICGKENYYELKKGLGRVKSRARFSMEVLNELPKRLGELQTLYQRTGGSHAAILFDGSGRAVIQGEDMGRHNALDKVIGAALMKGISCEDKILVSSGRASLEMILKTARAGVPLFMAMSRPTSRAVEAAKFYNITLLDMARGSNRIYSHARRIVGFERTRNQNPSE
ncbi:MAG: formate dehydrogenase accessory sulfurtransferase FdhD [Thermoplasmata archaeon]|nr:MAG: formate dehydrogenase accessory sulfurtransferase FdhD [Thermoplasmata archaeon]